MTTDTDRGAFDQAEYDRRFHGDFMYDATMEDEEGGGGRSPLFIILTALVLVAFGAVVYVAYQQGVTQGGDRNAPPVITAEAGPVRIAPEHPGGTTVPDQDKQIYERISPNDRPADAANETGLAAPPEEPIDLPAATPAGPSIPADAKVADTDTSGMGNTQMAAAVPAPPPPAPVATPVVTAATPEDDAKVKAAALTAEIAKTDPGAAAAAAGPGVESGAFVVQLGSFKSDGEAASMWQTVKTKNVDQLGNFKPAIKRVDLGSKGVWYRLRVGPFATRADATALCEVLKTRKSDCMVDTP